MPTLNHDELVEKLTEYVTSECEAEITAIKTPPFFIREIWALGDALTTQAIKILKDIDVALDESADAMIEAIAQVLDDALKLPIWAEPFDKTLFKQGLKWSFNSAKEKWGDEWPEEFIKYLEKPKAA